MGGLAARPPGALERKLARAAPGARDVGPTAADAGAPAGGVASGAMAPERDLFANFERMRREMDELFGDVFERAAGAAPARGFSPAVDVYYTGDPPRAVVRADLAGHRPRRASTSRSAAASWCSPATAAPRRRPRAASTSSSRSSTGRSGASSRSAPTWTPTRRRRHLRGRHPARRAAARAARARRAPCRSRSASDGDDHDRDRHGRRGAARSTWRRRRGCPTRCRSCRCARPSPSPTR